MQKKLISNDWYFSENAKDYKRIDLPHDYAISKDRDPHVLGGDSNGYYPDAEGTYVKYLTLDPKRHYILDVDGAYMRAHILLNENHVAYHPYGYSPYLADLTPYVIPNCTNKLKISLNPLHASTRWYSGNGIFRDVFLWEGGDIRIEPWDLFVTTVSIDGDGAKVRARVWVTADKAKTVILRLTFTAPDGTDVCRTETSIRTAKDKKVQQDVFTAIASPLLWDTEDPHLYTVTAEVCDGDTVCDTAVSTLGIRTVTANAKEGLLLNGKPLKLRGGCIHHDHGVLGAAASPAAEDR
ncbi:MAG: hypothetical protein IJW89_06800, partial [Clostridia bacterium]|nr:hypothetical protein [Clostridia bacterium]